VVGVVATCGTQLLSYYYCIHIPFIEYSPKVIMYSWGGMRKVLEKL
jgi:hypothetical protein